MSAYFTLNLDTTPPVINTSAVPNHVNRSVINIVITTNETLDNYQIVELKLGDYVIDRPTFTISGNTVSGTLDFRYLTDEVYTLYISLRDEVRNTASVTLNIVNGIPSATYEFSAHINNVYSNKVVVNTENSKSVIVELIKNINVIM